MDDETVYLRRSVPEPATEPVEAWESAVAELYCLSASLIF
jgi:hypothetical protein